MFPLSVPTCALLPTAATCVLAVAIYDMSNVLHFPPSMHPSFRLPRRGAIA